MHRRLLWITVLAGNNNAFLQRRTLGDKLHQIQRWCSQTMAVEEVNALQGTHSCGSRGHCTKDREHNYKTSIVARYCCKTLSQVQKLSCCSHLHCFPKFTAPGQPYSTNSSRLCSFVLPCTKAWKSVWTPSLTVTFANQNIVKKDMKRQADPACWTVKP